MRLRTLPATEAEAAWRAVESRAGDVPVACSWDWTATWLAHYGDVVAHRFVIGDDERGPAGAVLVTRQAGLPAWRPPTVHLGTAGEPRGTSVFVERNRLLVDLAARERFAEALGDHLARDRSWQRLRLDGFVEDDAEELLRHRPAACTEREECPVAELDGADGLAGLPGRRRQRVRRTLRDFGALTSHWAQTSAEAHDVLDELIELHGERWTTDGQAGAFASPRFTGFHRDLVERLVPGGRAALFRVRRDGETVGCLYGFVEGERLLFYQSGLRRYADNRLRAGMAAHALFMAACRERGLREYDFLAPAARYKLELATRCDRLVWADVERPGARLRLERAGRRARAALRRTEER